MEEKEQNPFEINSFGLFDLCKKRKLPDEHLCLPSPKHKHYSEGFSSKSTFLDGGLPETEPTVVQFIKGSTNVMCFDEESMPESVNESKSFSEELDSATSVFRVAKVELNQAMTCTYDSASSQSMSYGGGCSVSTHFSVESSTSMESSSTEQEAAFTSGENRLETVYKIQECLLELSFEDHDCGAYLNDDIELSTYPEIEDLYYSNRSNLNAYEAQTRAASPTIDREFEQYFSMLMM